jgi:hypothetical protein
MAQQGRIAVSKENLFRVLRFMRSASCPQATQLAAFDGQVRNKDAEAK